MAAEGRDILDALRGQGIVALDQRITESRDILDARDSRRIAAVDLRRARGRAFGNSWGREPLDERRRFQQAGIVDASGLEKLDHVVGAQLGRVDQLAHRGKLDDRMDAHLRDISDARRIEDKLKQLHLMGAEFVVVQDGRCCERLLAGTTGIQCRETSRWGVGESCSTKVGRELVTDVLGLDGRVEADAGLAN